MRETQVAGINYSRAISRPLNEGQANGAGSRRPDFARQLESSLAQLKSLKFSGHAMERLARRKVSLTAEKAERLIKAVDAAQHKGARESLVLLDEMAFVVSVRNRTVITACETSGLKEGIFTKIDSAVFG